VRWIIAQLALAVVLVATRVTRDDATVLRVAFPVIEVHRDASPPAPVPPPVPVAVARREPVASTCPAPVKTAPRANPKQFPEGVEHASAAITDARWLAAWDDQHVFVSRDGGGTFARVLDGPGRVEDVTFDCFGNALVLRGHQLGVFGDRESWHDVPVVAPREQADIENDGHGVLIGGGPEVIVVGSREGNEGAAWLVRSADRGATWTYRELDTIYETDRTTGRQDADGTIHLAIVFGDCMTDPLHWLELAGNQLTLVQDTDAWSHRAYVRGDIVYSDRHWRRRGDTEWRPITGMPDDDTRFITGGTLRAVVAGSVFRLEDGHATKLATVPTNTELATVDAAGRLWGIAKDGTEPPRLVLVR
jgi:hypothetical protein